MFPSLKAHFGNPRTELQSTIWFETQTELKRVSIGLNKKLLLSLLNVLKIFSQNWYDPYKTYCQIIHQIHPLNTLLDLNYFGIHGHR